MIFVAFQGMEPPRLCSANLVAPDTEDLRADLTLALPQIFFSRRPLSGFRNRRLALGLPSASIFWLAPALSDYNGLGLWRNKEA